MMMLITYVMETGNGGQVTDIVHTLMIFENRILSYWLCSVCVPLTTANSYIVFTLECLIPYLFILIFLLIGSL